MLRKANISLLILICITVSVFSQKVIPMEEINSQFDEVTPVLSTDGEKLYFTRIGYPTFNHTLIRNGEHITYQLSDNEVEMMMQDVYSEISGKFIENPVSSRFNQDIWVAYLDEEFNVDAISHPIYPLNNIYPNSVLAFNREKDEIIVINEFTESGSVYEGVSSVPENNYSNELPEPLPIKDFYTNDEQVNLTMNTDGDAIIWALNRDDSNGSRDLYISFFIGNSYWSAPENLGADINTEFRESTPFLSSDNKRLYFCSDRPGGYGGTDIYYSDRLDYSWKKWSEPRLMPTPINSEFNDSQPCPTSNENIIFFSSDREGDSNIYKYIQAETKKLETPLVLKMMILDTLTKEPISATIEYGRRGADYNELPNFFRTFNGEFQTEIETNHPTDFKISKPSYEVKTIRFDYNNLEDTSIRSHRLEVFLKPKSLSVKQAEPAKQEIEEDKKLEVNGKSFTVKEEFILEKIYFVRSKAQVLPKSIPALELLYMDIKQNNYKVLITGHTDNKGTKESLMKLSLERAAVIKKFLVMKGIEDERIITRGVGPDQPLNDNSTETLRRKNRRVEIALLKE